MAKEIKNENAEAVVEAVSKTEKFFNENGKLLGGIVLGLAVVAAAVFLLVQIRLSACSCRGTGSDGSC